MRGEANEQTLLTVMSARSRRVGSLGLRSRISSGGRFASSLRYQRAPASVLTLPHPSFERPMRNFGEDRQAHLNGTPFHSST